MYRLGGRESAPRYGGSFKTKREALARKAWLTGELAALRVPNLRLAGDAAAATLRSVAARWQASRVDVAPGTLGTYRVALGRILPRLGDQAINHVDAQMVAALVADLHEAGLRKQTIRKTVSVLAMVLDHARVQPNPARDRLTVRLPREERRQVEPPSAEQVEAVAGLLPKPLSTATGRARRNRHAGGRVRGALLGRRRRAAWPLEGRDQQDRPPAVGRSAAIVARGGSKAVPARRSPS
jgi:hypothetical protein